MCVFENVHVIQNAPFFGRFFCVKKNKKIYRINVRFGKRGIFENAHFFGRFFCVKKNKKMYRINVRFRKCPRHPKRTFLR